MKILHVIPHYLPSSSFGGSPISTHNMVVEQVRAGHHVHVLTTTVHPPKEKAAPFMEKHKDGYTIFRIPNLSNTIAYRFKFHLAPGVLWFLFRHAHEYDIIHLREYRTTLNVAAALLKWTTNAKYILQPHGVFLNFGGKETFKHVFDVLFKKTIDQSIDRVIAISQKEFDILAQEFPIEKISLIYHGIVEPSPKTTLPFSLPQKFLLYVGRLHQVKRLDYLLKAFARANLLKKREVHLVVAGNDEGCLESLQRLAVRLHINEFIHFIGAVNKNEKYSLYRRALATVYVTDNEPFGLVPLEAASVGCWSIIHEQSGAAELLRYETFADTIKGNTLKEFSVTMETAVRRKKKFSRSDRNRLLQKMSTAKQAQLLEETYREVLSETHFSSNFSTF